jgi:SAM-dependent methyltransferase
MKPFADHFSRISTEYAAFRPRYPARLFELLARSVPARRMAWDVGTGTGQAAVGLATWFDRVLATDASVTQVRRGEPHGRVRYVAARAEAGPVRDGAADLVAVAQALHWLDLDRFYAEATRALAPGGVVAVWTYGRISVRDASVDAVLDRFYYDEIGPWWPPERRWVDAGYAGLDFPFRPTPIEAPPMTEEWTLAELLGYIGTWSAVVRRREETGADPMGPLAERLDAVWGAADRRRRVYWKLTIRAGRP